MIRRIAPEAEILDVTHGIRPQDVLQGALVLAAALPFFPVGIHVAVVDPGVGGPRRAVALEGGDGRLYVGPDNGVLLSAADALGGVARAVELAEPAYVLEPVSATFHGRDVFAPAAAHLARGVPLPALGPELEPATLVRLEVPRPELDGGRIRSTALSADRFGNVQLNLTSADLDAAGLAEGARVVVERGDRAHAAVYARTFADVPPGDLVLYENASRWMALAVNGGSAAASLGVAAGDEVRLWPAA